MLFLFSSKFASSSVDDVLDNNSFIFYQHIPCVPKKRPPFYFLNNSQKLTDFNNFGMLNPAKI